MHVGVGVYFSSLDTEQKDGDKRAVTGAASSTMTDEGKRPREPFSACLWLRLLLPPLAPSPWQPGQLERAAPRAKRGLSTQVCKHGPACTASCCLLRGGTVALVSVFM